MLIVRAILAGLIAISVAMVPAAAGVYISTKPVEMSMAGHANTPCSTPNDCKDSIACAVKCFNFVGAIFPATVPLTHIVDAVPPSFVDAALHEYVRSPPTHPPPGLKAFRS